MPGVAKKLVNIVQAGPRENALVTHAPELAGEKLQQLDLYGRAGSKICMAAFRRHRSMRGAIPEKSGFAQAGAGSNDGAIALLVHAFAHHGIVPRPKRAGSVGDGLQIVEQKNALQLQRARQRLRLDDPRQVGGGGAAIFHWPSNAKAGSIDRTLRLRHKRDHDLIQAGVLAAGIGEFGVRFQAAALGFK